jgi:hypothetical protein
MPQASQWGIRSSLVAPRNASGSSPDSEIWVLKRRTACASPIGKLQLCKDVPLLSHKRLTLKLCGHLACQHPLQETRTRLPAYDVGERAGPGLCGES